MTAVRPRTEEEVRRAIAELDLEPIVFKLMHLESAEQRMRLEEADKCVTLYRKFLILTLLYPEKSIVPTKKIDAVWHAHILDTAKYRDDCERFFGRFIDHFPYLGLRGPEDAEKLREAFAETRELFKKHFGVDLVSDAQDCTGNECGTQCNGTSWCDGAGRADRPRPIRLALV